MMNQSLAATTTTTSASAQEKEQMPPTVVPASSSSPPPPRRSLKITVPQRAVQGGLDLKFEEDPYSIKLQGLLTPEEYTDAMQRINDMIKPSRSTRVDAGLLAAGPLLVPLAVWGVRHNRQVKRRKRLLMEAIQDFNESHPHLYMRWNRRPQSCLTVERRVVSQHGVAPPPDAAAAASVAGTAVAEPVSVLLLSEEDMLV